jgi:hypothetical protein
MMYCSGTSLCGTGNDQRNRGAVNVQREIIVDSILNTELVDARRLQFQDPSRSMPRAFANYCRSCTNRLRVVSAIRSALSGSLRPKPGRAKQVGETLVGAIGFEPCRNTQLQQLREPQMTVFTMENRLSRVNSTQIAHKGLRQNYS